MILAGIFSWFHDVLDWLETLSSNPWFYLIIFVIALLDSVVPIVPSETTVILGGIAAGQGELWIVLVIILGAAGAFVGDTIAYWLGRRFGPFITRKFFRKGNGEEQVEKARAQIAKRGGLLLITARFIPGGRTLMTFSCGVTRQDYVRWFIPWDALAAILWASYAGILGYVFGDNFEHTTAFLLAFFTALGITALIEVVRWFRHRNAAEESVAV